MQRSMGISLTRFKMLSQQMGQPVLSRIFALRWEYMQGNRQLSIHLGAYFACVKTVSRHNARRLLKAESTTMTLPFQLNKALTAPILLPHSATTYPLASKKAITLSASRLSLTPKVTHSPSLLPQPSKSKHTSPTLSGSLSNMAMPQILLELFPCRQRRQYSGVLSGVNIETGKGMRQTVCRNFGVKDRMRQRQVNFGGRISMNVSRSVQFVGENFWMWKLWLGRGDAIAGGAWVIEIAGREEVGDEGESWVDCRVGRVIWNADMRKGCYLPQVSSVIH